MTVRLNRGYDQTEFCFDALEMCELYLQNYNFILWCDSKVLVPSIISFQLHPCLQFTWH